MNNHYNFQLSREEREAYTFPINSISDIAYKASRILASKMDEMFFSVVGSDSKEEIEEMVKEGRLVFHQHLEYREDEDGFDRRKLVNEGVFSFDGEYYCIKPDRGFKTTLGSNNKDSTLFSILHSSNIDPQKQ